MIEASANNSRRQNDIFMRNFQINENQINNQQYNSLETHNIQELLCILKPDLYNKQSDMAVPFIQIGQCGNQVGQAFFNTMYEQGAKASQAHQGLLSQFFYQGQIAKALLVDMQPKVVNKCLAKKGNWGYNSKWSLVKQQGSGNNWAYGCYVHGPSVKQDLQKMLHKMVEQEDYINSFVQLQSLAGGTGSGLGTYVLSLLDQLFPKTPKFVGCVLPHLSGQVILQAYNATLSLGTIYGMADGIFLMQNDEMNKICTDQLNIKKPQLQNINKVVSRTLASFYFPVISKNTSSLHSIQLNGLNYGRELVEEIFFDNRYKLASIKCAPQCQANFQSFNSDSWQSIQNQLLLRPKPFKAKIFIGRGQDHPQTTIVHNSIKALYDRHNFYGYPRSGAVVQNGVNCVNSLQKILERAYGMMGQGAYLYQYKKYGIERDQLQECQMVMQNIQVCYKQLK